jgi:hypothetical protein
MPRLPFCAKRNKTHCINGHLLAEHSRINTHKGISRRQCRPCDVEMSPGEIIKPAVFQKVTAQIIAGSSINNFTKSGPNYLVKFSTFARCRREKPEFDRLVTEAISDRLYRGAPHYEWDPVDLQAIPAYAARLGTPLLRRNIGNTGSPPMRQTELERFARKSQLISAASRTSGWRRLMIASRDARNRSSWRSSRGSLTALLQRRISPSKESQTA